MIRKTTIILIGLLLITSIFATLSLAGANNGNDGPSDNSGDGISDGSEFDSPNGPNSETDTGNGNGEPAPNSGDGNPDGSGW
jgi:hypothetical protein